MAPIYLKRGFRVLFIILLILMTWLLVVHPDWIVAGPPKAGALAPSDKYDGDCTGTETAGRCADKFVCPDDTYPIDEANHICKANPTGCPYGDSIPLGPDCDKHTPTVYNANEASDPVMAADQFAGK